MAVVEASMVCQFNAHSCCHPADDTVGGHYNRGHPCGREGRDSEEQEGSHSLINHRNRSCPLDKHTHDHSAMKRDTETGGTGVHSGNVQTAGFHLLGV